MNNYISAKEDAAKEEVWLYNAIIPQIKQRIQKHFSMIHLICVLVYILHELWKSFKRHNQSK